MAHPHCFSCISAICAAKVNCPVITCSECETRLHQCKFDEHSLYTCWSARVPCINATSGCEEILPRRQLSRHLEHCPASTLKCSFSYNRRSDTFRQSSHHQPSGSPRTINLLVSPSGTEHRSRAVDEQKLLDEIFFVEDVVLSQQEDMYARCTDPTQVEHLSEGSPLFDINVINNFSTFTTVALPSKCSANSCFPQSRLCVELVTATHDFFERMCIVTRSYNFPCHKIVRRDEFASHWNDYHLTMQTGVHCIVERCPMFGYGCKHGRVRLSPDPNGSCLSYNLDADCFGLKLPVKLVEAMRESSSEECIQHLHKKKKLAPEVDGVLDLNQLPVEILIKISFYLDSLSLWNLSQVSHYIRNVCFNAVKKRGIVYWVWEKNATTKKWEQGPKV